MPRRGRCAPAAAPRSARCAPVAHVLRPSTTHSSPSSARGRRQRGEVGPGVRLAEQQAPRGPPGEDRRARATAICSALPCSRIVGTDDRHHRSRREDRARRGRAAAGGSHRHHARRGHGHRPRRAAAPPTSPTRPGAPTTPRPSRSGSQCSSSHPSSSSTTSVTAPGKPRRRLTGNSGGSRHGAAVDEDVGDRQRVVEHHDIGGPADRQHARTADGRRAGTPRPPRPPSTAAGAVVIVATAVDQGQPRRRRGCAASRPSARRCRPACRRRAGWPRSDFVTRRPYMRYSPSGIPARETASVTATKRRPVAACVNRTVSAATWTRSQMTPTCTSARAIAAPPTAGSREVGWRCAFHRWVTIVAPASNAAWATSAVASVWPSETIVPRRAQVGDQRRARRAARGRGSSAAIGAAASHSSVSTGSGARSQSSRCAPRRSGDRNGPSRWTPSTSADPAGRSAHTRAAVASAAS